MSNTNIRQETTQKLGLTKNPSLRQQLTEDVNNFCGYNFPDASATLFKLLYEEDEDVREETFRSFKFTLSSVDSFRYEFFFITEEMADLIADELQFQYIQTHPAFLKVKDFPGCEEELNAIKVKMAGHPLLLFRAVESAFYEHKNEDVISDCVKPLLSEKIASQLNGLANLKHNHKYQKLLLPYAKEIGTLLQAMHETYMARQRVAAAQEELNLPFTMPLSGLLEKKQADEAVEPANEPAVEPAVEPEQPCEEPVQPVVNSSYTVPAEFQKFIDHKSDLIFDIPNSDEFWKLMKKLRTLGLDLNLLVDHLSEVVALLNAHDAMEKASDILRLAQQEYDTALSRFSELCGKPETR